MTLVFYVTTFSRRRSVIQWNVFGVVANLLLQDEDVLVDFVVLENMLLRRMPVHCVGIPVPRAAHPAIFCLDAHQCRCQSWEWYQLLLNYRSRMHQCTRHRATSDSVELRVK